MLTHDVDVMSLREVSLRSRTFWGFPYRCTVENFRRLRNGDMKLGEYIGSVAWAIGALFTKVGIGPDPWLSSFRRMIEIERYYNVRSTLFLIPFKARPGHLSDGTLALPKRSAHYQLETWQDYLVSLQRDGWELGCHGIDCHMGPEHAREEYLRIANMFSSEVVGLRMHWLVTSARLTYNAVHAGFAYDSTTGYNEGAGYPEEWIKPYRDAATGMPIVPLHVQDSALLGEWRLGMRRKEATGRINEILDQAAERQGVVTVLWHSNSFGPPRYWSDVYVCILERALRDGARIVRACDVACL